MREIPVALYAVAAWDGHEWPVQWPSGLRYLKGPTGPIPRSCTIVVEHDQRAAPLSRAVERLLRNGYVKLKLRQLPRRKKP